MGEIADGILNGDFDCETGEYIGEGYGCPRTLSGNRPLPNYTPKAKIIIWNFLNQKGILNDGVKTELIENYGKYKNSRKKGASQLCITIRSSKQDWKEFKEWFNKTQTKL